MAEIDAVNSSLLINSNSKNQSTITTGHDRSNYSEYRRVSCARLVSGPLVYIGLLGDGE